jgi:hypothetical protein
MFIVPEKKHMHQSLCNPCILQPCFIVGVQGPLLSVARRNAHEAPATVDGGDLGESRPHKVYSSR